MPCKNSRALSENLPPATTAVCAFYKELLRKSPSRVAKKIMITASMWQMVTGPVKAGAGETEEM